MFSRAIPGSGNRCPLRTAQRPLRTGQSVNATEGWPSALSVCPLTNVHRTLLGSDNPHLTSRLRTSAGLQCACGRPAADTHDRRGATVPRNRVVRYVGHPSVRASDSYHPGVPHGRAPNSGTGDTVSAHPDASPSRAAGQRASFDYDAFISYTHHDRPVAAGIQKWMMRRQRSGPRVSQRSAPTSTFWAGVGVDLVSLSTARTESSS